MRKIQAVDRKESQEKQMTPRQIEIQFRLLEKRRKYDLLDDPAERERKHHALTKIANSLYVVYPDWETASAKICNGIQNRKQTKIRTNKYLQGMMECYDNLYFVTLTFNDDTMEKTSEKTRRQYVSRYLDKNCRDYYANIDFGEQNQREHYHAVVSDTLVLEDWHKHGAIHIKRIRKGKKDVRKIATYIRKLANHANKVTTGRAFHKRGIAKEIGGVRVYMKEIDNLPF